LSLFIRKSSPFGTLWLVLGILSPVALARAEPASSGRLRDAQGIDTSGLTSEELKSLGLSPPESLPLKEPKGRKPKTPKAELPEGIPHPSPSSSSRLGIREQAPGSIPAPLRALELAEMAMFPESTPGLESGFDWSTASAEESSRAVLGLPGRNAAIDPEVGGEDLKWLSSLTLPDLPIRLDRRVVTYLKFYRDSARGRTIAAIWARKSGRYVPAIQAELRRAGLPTDLVWLSLIESSHEPTITSPAGAVGLWQFVPDSARMYGLTVDAWVDERRDPVQSTKAAIRFLTDLYARFQSWELAMAAYNMGYAGLSRTMGKFNTNSYWLLSRLEGGLPWETTLYVPKIYALAIVMNNREAFGLGRMTPDPAISFDTISVEPLTPISSIAALARVTEETIRALNPALLASRTPPSNRPIAIHVPEGQGEAVLKGLRSGPKPRTVRVRQGDNVTTVAARFGVSEASLLTKNGVAAERVGSGTVLILPDDARKDPVDPIPPVVVVHHRLIPGPSERLVFYEVQLGDQLRSLASRFQVSEADLRRNNSLDGDALLRAGMVLQVLVPRGLDLRDVRCFEGPDVHTLLAGSPEFHKYYEGLRGYERIVVEARPGDTLASIGRRYGVTVGSMERINRRSQSSPLVEGESIIVYTDKAHAASRIEPGRGALPPIVSSSSEASHLP
jgi:membrane-bound lytic murein transglycosylase D